MYFLFRLHHKFPNEYYTLPNNEKKIVREFLKQEITDLNKEIKGE